MLAHFGGGGLKYIEKIFNFSRLTHPDTLTVLISDPNYVSPEGGSSEGSSTALRAPLSAAFGAHHRSGSARSAAPERRQPRGVPTLRRISLVKTNSLRPLTYPTAFMVIVVVWWTGGWWPWRFPRFLWAASFAFSRSAFSLQNGLLTHTGVTVACFWQGIVSTV